MATDRIELEISEATIRGLRRKRGLTLNEYLMLGPTAQKFILAGPFGQSNREVIDRALAARKAKQ